MVFLGHHPLIRILIIYLVTFKPCHLFIVAEKHYESVADHGNISSRDEKLKKILEGTEQYERLIYFTPEKSLITNKVTNIFLIKDSWGLVRE